MSEAQPILVVGATGRIGREVTQRLLAAGRPVRALVRSGSRIAMPSQAGVEIATGDLGDRASLDAAVQNVAATFVAVRDHPDQVQWESNLVDSLEAHAPVPIVKVSAFAASLDPPPGYGRIHAAIEARLHASSLPWTVLQPYMYMQNFLELAAPARHLGRLPLPLGDARVAFIDARDVARAAAVSLLAGDHTGQTHVLTGAESLRGADVAAALGHALGRNVKYLALPPWLAGGVMRLSGVGAWDVTMRAELFQMLRDGGESQTSDAYTRLTGQVPTTLERFIHDHRPVFQGALD